MPGGGGLGRAVLGLQVLEGLAAVAALCQCVPAPTTDQELGARRSRFDRASSGRFIPARIFMRSPAEGALKTAGILGRGGSIQRFAEAAVPFPSFAQKVRRMEFLGSASPNPAAVRGKSLGSVAAQLDGLPRFESAIARTAADARGQ